MPPKPKLSESQMQEIAARLASDPSLSQAALAQEYGIDAANISRALAKRKTPLADSHSIYIPFAQLITSPLNPRKTFDDSEIDELAESIAQDGLLQNLVVRPGPDDTYIIVSGERRYRALAVLHINNRLNTPVPCRVVAADDAKHLVLALLENLARVDVPPLEEASAFLELQSLDPQTWSARGIAKAISRSARYVQQRIALATKLSPETRQMLAQGHITVEAARLLCAIEPAAQADILETLRNETGDDHFSTDQIRYEIKHSFIPTSRALFDIPASGLAIFEDEGDEYFMDRAAFWQHQDAAVETTRAELAQIWSWVIVSRRGDGVRLYDYLTDEAAPRSQAGAIIMIDANGLIHIETALVKRADKPAHDFQSASPAPSSVTAVKAEPPAASPVTKKHIYHAHARKTEALRDKICADAKLAMRLACYSLLHPSNPIACLVDRSRELAVDDRVPILDHHAGIIRTLVEKIKKPLNEPYVEKSHLIIWQHIESLNEKSLHDLFAALIARGISTPAGLECNLGDRPVAIAVAKAAGLHGQEHLTDLTIQREDLNGIRKQTLLTLADDFGTPAINDELSPKDLADAIAKHSAKHILPTLRFATTAEIVKELAAK